MKHYEAARRFGSQVLAALVAILTVSILVHATQTITTPNASLVTYNLAAGANSGAITPVANQSVLVMGTQTAVGFRGTGHVTMLRISGSFLEWTGIESPAGAALTSGFSAVAGTHIVWIDYSHQVDIQVNAADSFRVHNGSTGVRTGNVTLVW
jgi:hypothetical protein